MQRRKSVSNRWAGKSDHLWPFFGPLTPTDVWNPSHGFVRHSVSRRVGVEKKEPGLNGHVSTLLPPSLPSDTNRLFHYFSTIFWKNKKTKHLRNWNKSPKLGHCERKTSRLGGDKWTGRTWWMADNLTACQIIIAHHSDVIYSRLCRFRPPLPLPPVLFLIYTSPFASDSVGRQTDDGADVFLSPLTFADSLCSLLTTSSFNRLVPWLLGKILTGDESRFPVLLSVTLLSMFIFLIFLNEIQTIKNVRGWKICLSYYTVSCE